MSKDRQTPALAFEGSTDCANIDGTMDRIGDDTQGSMLWWHKSPPIRWWRLIQRFRVWRFWRAHRVLDDSVLIDLSRLPTGEWTHISLVQDGAEPVIYVNQGDRPRGSWWRRLLKARGYTRCCE